MPHVDVDADGGRVRREPDYLGPGEELGPVGVQEVLLHLLQTPVDYVDGEAGVNVRRMEEVHLGPAAPRLVPGQLREDVPGGDVRREELPGGQADDRGGGVDHVRDHAALRHADAHPCLAGPGLRDGAGDPLEVVLGQRNLHDAERIELRILRAARTATEHGFELAREERDDHGPVPLHLHVPVLGGHVLVLAAPTVAKLHVPLVRDAVHVLAQPL
mmetsp:Transcript_21759/g.61123  ORF Transcript_21759/g.61123 Transcript_21759/m.61123 type:complete len:216 (-) Transcript_21759:1201-1848(-)